MENILLMISLGLVSIIFIVVCLLSSIIAFLVLLEMINATEKTRDKLYVFGIIILMLGVTYILGNIIILFFN